MTLQLLVSHVTGCVCVCVTGVSMNPQALKLRKWVERSSSIRLRDELSSDWSASRMLMNACLSDALISRAAQIVSG